MKNPLVEALKEVARYAFFIGVSAFITAVIEQLTKLPDQDIVVLSLTLAFRALDKYMFEKRKIEDPGSSWKGLLPK